MKLDREEKEILESFECGSPSPAKNRLARNTQATRRRHSERTSVGAHFGQGRIVGQPQMSNNSSDSIQSLTKIIEQILRYRTNLFSEPPCYEQIVPVLEDVRSQQFVSNIARDVAALLDEDPISWDNSIQRFYLLLDLEMLRHSELSSETLFACRKSLTRPSSRLWKLVQSGSEPTREEIAKAVREYLVEAEA
jgi:hypothetical protein